MQWTRLAAASAVTLATLAGCGSGGGGGGGAPASPLVPTTIVATPGQVEFAPVAAGASATSDVTVTNADPARTITVTTATIEAGPAASIFSVTPSEPLATALAPGRGTVLHVGFAPSAAGDFVGVLAVVADTGDVLRVPLHGNATSTGGGGGGGGNGGDGGGTSTFPDGRPLELITRSSSGQPMEAGATVIAVAISGGGRFVAFDSSSSTLVPGDTNGHFDVFVRDRLLGTTTRASVSGTGEQLEQSSFLGGISADGRYVAFTSARTATTNQFDLYVKDRSTGALSRLAHDDDVVAIGGISGDGRLVVFITMLALAPQDINGEADVYVWNRVMGTVTLVSANLDGTAGRGDAPQIARDGGHVVFKSPSADMVANDVFNNDKIFIRDLATSTTRKVDLEDADETSWGPQVSRDGRYVAFVSQKPNGTTSFGGTFVRDMQTGDLRNVLPFAERYDHPPTISLSGDGRFLAAFVSNSASGRQGYAVIDLSDGSRADLTTLPSEQDPGSGVGPAIVLSSGGTYAAFLSTHALLPEDTHADGLDIYAAPVPQ
jgi:Tol biopolymer transport system component